MLKVDHLTIGHDGRDLVRDISFELVPGECVLLAGPNGTGKTTLLKWLASGGIGPENLRSQSDLRPSHKWAPPSHVPRVAQFSGPIPPEAAVVLIPTNIPKVKGFTVEAFVRTGCYRESDWLRKRDISTLSDGEFQKACLATGLTRRAEVLLLDEPTAHLDVENRIDVLRTLREVARKTGTAVLFSSHDLHDALQVADRVFVLTRDGRFLASAGTDVLRAAFPALANLL